MNYKDTPYFKVATARDLTGTERLMYRFFEMIPGLLSWGTLLGIIIFSWVSPVIMAYFIIAFDLYWLIKNFYLSAHLRYNWKRMKRNIATDWQAKLGAIEHDHVHHMILLPFYKESEEVVFHSIEALINTRYDHKKMIVVLASEERAGAEAQQVATKALEKYAHVFGDIIVTVHPKDIPGELPGKGSNIAYAAEQAKIRVIDPRGLKYEDVLVSAFDIDSVAYPDYFNCVTWHFLTTPDRNRASFQPVPVYNNNIWDAPSVSRVAAASSTFWQMIQQERPEKLSTFSSHAVPFSALEEIGYWQKNMVSEDSRIFFNLFFANDGKYRVVPIAYPVSMDANLDASFWQTMKNIYKQHRRWMWGAENIPYILLGCIKNKNIPLRKRLSMVFIQIEGFWSLATNPIMIFLLGWLPVAIGGAAFKDTILAHNLPTVTGYLMLVTMLGLIVLAVISQSLLPPRPAHIPKRRKFTSVLQWLLVPITITIFGAIPGLDAQTRLLLGKYMGFWVTPKHRAQK